MAEVDNLRPIGQKEASTLALDAVARDEVLLIAQHRDAVGVPDMNLAHLVRVRQFLGPFAIDHDAISIRLALCVIGRVALVAGCAGFFLSLVRLVSAALR